MYESRRHRPIPTEHFIRRLLLHSASALAIVLAPVIHRVLHTFHWEGEQ